MTTVEQAVKLAPITDVDLVDVADFLGAHMQSGVPATTWRTAMDTPWRFPQPNHGFHLRADGVVVGAYLAFYSERAFDGNTEKFCNLAAWCVLESFRADGLRLLRAMLAQRGYHFTDLSPSGNVVALNQRLRFTVLDTTTAFVANLPLPIGGSDVRVISDPAGIDGILSGREVEIYRDHLSTLAARHVVLTVGDRTCYVIYRRDRRKRLPLFASVLYISDPEIFEQTERFFFSHLLVRHGIPITMIERRLAGRRPRMSVVRQGRPRMFRSASLRPDQVDYLYSELTCVPW